MFREGPTLLRYRHWLWGVPLLFVLLNATLLSMYRGVYASRVDQLRTQQETRSQALAGLQQERTDLEALLGRAESSRRGVEELYGSRFSTQHERLTAVIAEVKDLARRSGLEPGSISYPEEAITRHGLVKKSIVFTVEGSYLSLRRFINFLELSGSFLVLEGIRVSQSDPDLNINLTISTLFAEPQEDGAKAERRSSDV